ncbi:Alpha-Beta hydrolase fold [Babesia duncani]|uniref:Alpha-Beta hydrolase fold n=1 Tax=Babesia duncani TaxID=323732 RepID=A0AAD9PH81_9APIC|nr:Alpha-Beta hydrolase fold [Babesia duncani]
MTVCKRPSLADCKVMHLLSILFLVFHFGVYHVYCKHLHDSTGPRHLANNNLNKKSQYEHISNGFVKKDKRVSRKKGHLLHAALIASDENSPEEPPQDEPQDTEWSVDFDVVKEQIFSELRQSEHIIKNVFTRIADHILQYMKQRVANSFLQFYIINPLGMGIGNLLNTELNDEYLTRKIGIPIDATPKTFKMDHEEVEVPSNFGARISKRCWFIKSKNPKATSAYVLLHGWFGNLQSCLPFASILNKSGVLSDHHILIVDLRDHVGKSFESNIGLKGVTDIYDAVSYLNLEYGVDKISIYAQSVTSLSALMFADLCHGAKDANTSDTGLATTSQNCPVVAGMDLDLDSKLASRAFPHCNRFKVSFIVLWFNECRMGGHIGRLSLKTFLKNPHINRKVHVLQGLSDTITTPEMLHLELTGDDPLANVNLYTFKGAGHTDLCCTCPDAYATTVKRIVTGGWPLDWIASLFTTTSAIDELVA